MTFVFPGNNLILTLCLLRVTYFLLFLKLNTSFYTQRNMKAIFTLGFLLSTLLYICTADIYLHNPPGSNNRLNGNQANVRNANRLFDSQVCLNLLIRNIFLASHIYILPCSFEKAAKLYQDLRLHRTSDSLKKCHKIT